MNLMDMIKKSIEKTKQAQKQEKEQQTALKQLSEIKIPARVDEKENETSGVDHVYSEEEKAAKEYFDHCHNNVNHVAAKKWLVEHDLSYADAKRWNIGFDVEEYAIIIPVDNLHYGKYTIDEKRNID